jgi:hypothetical protein
LRGNQKRAVFLKNLSSLIEVGATGFEPRSTASQDQRLVFYQTGGIKKELDF